MEGRTESFLHDLYNAHYDRLIKTAYRMIGDSESAQDLVQQVFLLALLHKEDLATHPAPEGWLVLALHNLINHEWRRKKYHQEVPLDELNVPIDQDSSLSLADVLPKELSPREREILIWRFEQQLEYSEIAERLGISASGCRSRVSRAIANCRKYLTGS